MNFNENEEIDNHIDELFLLKYDSDSMKVFMSHKIWGKNLALKVLKIRNDLLSKQPKEFLEKNIKLMLDKQDSLYLDLETVNDIDELGNHSDKYYEVFQAIKYYINIECRLETRVDDINNNRLSHKVVVS